MTDKPRLLDITDRIRQLQAMEGTIDEAAFRDTLDGLEGEFDDKVIRCIKMRDSILRENEAMAKILAAYARKVQRVIDTAVYLERYVLGEMKAAGRKKVETPEMTIAVRDYPKVEILVVDDVPSQLMRTKPPETITYEPAPDKKAIKAQLVAGETVPGCTLESNPKLVVTYPTVTAVEKVEAGNAKSE